MGRLADPPWDRITTLKKVAWAPWPVRPQQGHTRLETLAPIMSFNLNAPPGFRGLAPELPVEIYTRNLPHWRQNGATYFLTFNLGDALPGPKKRQLKSMRRAWEQQHPPPREEATWVLLAKTLFRTAEKWMDAGYGKCRFRDDAYADELHRRILHFHMQRYEIGCFVIMANHCHLVIRPLELFDLRTRIGIDQEPHSQIHRQTRGREGSVMATRIV